MTARRWVRWRRRFGPCGRPIPTRTRASAIRVKSYARRPERPAREVSNARESRNDMRLRIHRRIRKRISGSPERPRLAVFRSLKHIYAQIIDDEKGHTLVAAASTEKDLRGNGGNVEGAK